MICGGTAVSCLVCGGAGSCKGTTERPRHTSRRSQDVIHFLKTCGEENLQFLPPARLKKSLDYLDTDGSGELDVDEWRRAASSMVSGRSSDVASTPSTVVAAA